MHHEKHHVSDEELLLAADAELSPERTAEVAAHLAGCPACAARMKKIESAAASLVRAYHDDLDTRLPSAASSRATLESRMAAVASESARSKWRDWAGNVF